MFVEFCINVAVPEYVNVFSVFNIEYFSCQQKRVDKRYFDIIFFVIKRYFDISLFRYFSLSILFFYPVIQNNG